MGGPEPVGAVPRVANTLRAMLDHLEELARALHRVSADEDASHRLLELAAIATMQAATLDALYAEAALQIAEPERLAA